MCLGYIVKELTEKFKKQTTPIIAYKVVEKTRNGKYKPSLVDAKNFHIGENEAVAIPLFAAVCESSFYGDLPYCETEYESGFHAHLSIKDGAKNSADFLNLHNNPKKFVFIIIEILINPKDVICVGVESGNQVIVTKKMTIQSFNDISSDIKLNA